MASLLPGLEADDGGSPRSLRCASFSHRPNLRPPFQTPTQGNSPVEASFRVFWRLWKFRVVGARSRRCAYPRIPPVFVHAQAKRLDNTSRIPGIAAGPPNDRGQHRNRSIASERPAARADAARHASRHSGGCRRRGCSGQFLEDVARSDLAPREHRWKIPALGQGGQRPAIHHSPDTDRARQFGCHEARSCLHLPAR